MSTFEIVKGVDGDCLVLDGTRICGPKPWGGGRIIDTFRTDGIYEVIDKDEYHKLRDENERLQSVVSDGADNARELIAENAKLREWCADLYVLCYPHEVDWKLADSTWEKYEPCGLCKERHGGKSPCASTSEDMSEECCDPYQAELFAKCMAELGIELGLRGTHERD